MGNQKKKTTPKASIMKFRTEVSKLEHRKTRENE